MGLGSRSSSGAPNIPPPADYIANENIRQENMSNYEPEAKRQRRVELIREVRQFGGAIVRGPVPLHIKQEAEELAKIFEIDGVALYGWTGQQPSSGFFDRPPATLGVFASLDRF
jgi:hypothetical protein